MDKHVQFGRVSNTSKVEMWGWTVVDEPGEFRWIDKSKLQVDRSYQRDHTTNRSKKIAGEFSWLAFGCLIVADREGALFVVDGQHSLHAARLRSDIIEVPCMVFKTSSAKQEADGFHYRNTNRKSPQMRERFKCELLRGDKAAIVCDELLRQSGYSISHGAYGKSIKCIGAMMRCAATDEDALRRVWPLVIGVSDGGPIHERILQGLHYIESNTEGLARFADAVRTAGKDALLAQAGHAAALYANGGAKVWARGMLELINKRRRNKLELIV